MYSVKFEIIEKKNQEYKRNDKRCVFGIEDAFETSVNTIIKSRI